MDTIIPTKEEVKALLIIAIDNKLIHMKTIGELLGMKLLDSLIPGIKGGPAWGYEGLSTFFVNHNIPSSFTLEEALEKLK